MYLQLLGLLKQNRGSRSGRTSGLSKYLYDLYIPLSLMKRTHQTQPKDSEDEISQESLGQ